MEQASVCLNFSFAGEDQTKTVPVEVEVAKRAIPNVLKFNMLTDLELKVMDWVYRWSCKYFTIPLSWQNGRITLKFNHWVLSNCFMFILPISTLSFMLFQYSALMDKKDVNASMMYGVLLIYYISLLSYKLCTWIFRKQIVRLINETLLVNTVWGKGKS